MLFYEVLLHAGKYKSAKDVIVKFNANKIKVTFRKNETKYVYNFSDMFFKLLTVKLLLCMKGPHETF